MPAIRNNWAIRQAVMSWKITSYVAYTSHYRPDITWCILNRGHGPLLLGKKAVQPLA